MTEQNKQLIPHYNMGGRGRRISVVKLEEAIRKGLIPYTHYTTETPGDSNKRREVWYLTLEQVEQAGITLRAQQYAELEAPQETRLGVTRRVYNYSLRSARLRQGLTQRQLDVKAGLPIQTIAAYESLREFPSPERARAVADALGVSVESIFAEWLTEFKLERAPSILDDAHFSFEEALEAGIQLPSLPNPEEHIEREELRLAMVSAMSDLTLREKRVLELRFGLNEEEPLTLEEVGLEFGVTRSQIHQIQKKALRKLRHPTRSRKLRDFRE